MPCESPRTWNSMCRGSLEVLLEVDVGVAEGLSASARAVSKRVGELALVARHAHPAPAAAGRGLEDDRVARLRREGERLVRPTRAAPSLPGTIGTPAAATVRRARDLVAHPADRLGRRADERDVALLADLGEVGVLGQEAVARMDRVGVGDLGRRDDRRRCSRYEAARRGGPDADVLVGEAHVERVAVGLGVDGDRLDAELAAGRDDPQGDLAPVGDEDLLEHRRAATLARRIANSVSPYSTGWPFSTGRPSTTSPVDVRLDLVHQLHRLDDAEDLPLARPARRPRRTAPPPGSATGRRCRRSAR